MAELLLDIGTSGCRAVPAPPPAGGRPGSIAPWQPARTTVRSDPTHGGLRDERYHRSESSAGRRWLAVHGPATP